ncbi:MAG: hypothetical protein JO218_13135 [Burkholderiales bacterium]|nr:hypothetical protein [Burkholderiales bacterium]
MRRTLVVIGIQLSLAAAVVWAADVDISTDLMQSIEDTTKDLDSNVALKDGQQALHDAKALATLFDEVEQHFHQASDAPRGVELSQQSHRLVDAVASKVAANDFDAAATSVDQLEHTCKQCHQLYKPPKP